jgi:hypothetical protein
MRYRLRTLLILVAILPPLLWIGWMKYKAWQAEQVEQEQRRVRGEWLDRFGVLPPPQVLREEIGETGPR